MTDILTGVLVNQEVRIPKFSQLDAEGNGPQLEYKFSAHFRPAQSLVGDAKKIVIHTEQMGNGIEAPVEVSVIKPGSTTEIMLDKVKMSAAMVADFKVAEFNAAEFNAAPTDAGVFVDPDGAQVIPFIVRPPELEGGFGTDVFAPPAPDPRDRFEHTISDDDPNGEWTVRIKNLGPNLDEIFRIRIRHPDMQLTITESKIPFSLVWRLVQKVHRLVVPFVKIDVDATIDFGKEFKKLSGLTRLRHRIGTFGGFGVEVRANNIRLEEMTIGIQATTPETIALDLEARFETGGGDEIVVSPGPNLNFSKLEFAAQFEFGSSETFYLEHRLLTGDLIDTRLPSGKLKVTASAEVGVDTSINQLRQLVTGGVDGALTKYRNSSGTKKALAVAAEHFMDMLMFLAAGNDDEVYFALRSTADDIIVRHYQRPTTGLRLRHRLEEPAVDPDAGGVVLGAAAARTERAARGPGAAAAVNGAGAVFANGGAVAGPGAGLFDRVVNVNDPQVAVDLPQASERKIDHIVVLMLENRSFDHLLGYLTHKKGRADIDGLGSLQNHTNPVPGSTELHQVFRLGHGNRIQVDPRHGVSAVADQIAGGAMSGFVADYMKKAAIRDNLGQEHLVMGFYDDEKMGAFDQLADEFLVCDRWFCSHPGATYPNRFISVMGTAPEVENFEISDGQAGAVKGDTVFDVLGAAGVSWKYVESNIAFLRMFDKYRVNETDIMQRGDWITLAENGQLPAVSWIDPNTVYLEFEEDADDDHPPSNVEQGQRLVEKVYTALRANSDQWARTLFIITYDEHGGLYDHVAPHGLNGTVDPPVEKIHPDGANHYGPRVPTIIVSPWVSRGASSVVFDHTSIIKTILENFVGPEAVTNELLGPRVDAANSLLPLLNASPRLDIPQFDPLPPIVPPPEFDETGEPVETDSYHLAMGLFGLGPRLRGIIADRAEPGG